MALIICMAGFNTRFHDVGFDIPKYLLPWGKSTIIHSILSELNYSGETILLANKRDHYFKSKLVDSIKPLGYDESNIFYINDTSGQAHTTAIGADLIRSKETPLFVHNADTIVTNRNFDYMEKTMQENVCAAFIDVFVASSPKYCYIRGVEGVVSDIVEKEAISPYASSGLYGFINAHEYLKSYNELLTKVQKSEVYVSNVLSDMLRDNKSIAFNPLNAKCETIVLGSPQEYGIEFVKKNYEVR